jgi:hypothetical protein
MHTLRSLIINYAISFFDDFISLLLFRFLDSWGFTYCLYILCFICRLLPRFSYSFAFSTRLFHFHVVFDVVFTIADYANMLLLLFYGFILPLISAYYLLWLWISLHMAYFIAYFLTTISLLLFMSYRLPRSSRPYAHFITILSRSINFYFHSFAFYSHSVLSDTVAANYFVASLLGYFS